LGRDGSVRALVASQFLGSFNDNALKLLAIVLARRAAEGDPTLTLAAQEDALYEATVATFVAFTLPHVLLFAPAGWLADRLSRRDVLVAAKCVEVMLLLLASALLFHDPRGGWLLIVLLVLMGVRNTLLSPSKYGIVPDLAGWGRLAAANGLLEAWTFAGIIAGAALGPWFAHWAGDEPAWAALGLVALSLVGLAAVWAIPRVEPARHGSFAAPESGFRDPWLRFALAGAFMFWVVASVIGQDFVVYAKSVLGLPEAQQSLLLALLGIGVGAGALLAGRLSRGRIETRFVPLAAFAMAGFTLAAGLVRPGLGGTVALLGAMGVAGGLVIVPVDSLLQARAPHARRGAVIATANLLVFGGMLVGFLLGGALNRAGLDAAGILVAASVPALLLAGWAYRRERDLRTLVGPVTPKDEAAAPG